VSYLVWLSYVVFYLLLIVVITKLFPSSCPQNQNNIFLQSLNLLNLNIHESKTAIRVDLRNTTWFATPSFFSCSVFPWILAGEIEVLNKFEKWGEDQQIFEGQCGEGFLMRCGGHCAVQWFFSLSIFWQKELRLSLDRLCPRYCFFVCLVT
jgi:hypothetical protein